MLSTRRWPAKGIALLLCGTVFLWASGIAPQAYRTVQANSSSATPAPTLNFQDTGTVTWTCSTAAGVTTCQATSSSSGGYSTIENSGTPLTMRTTVNMQGTGVSCADSGGITVCTINGTGVANFAQAFTAQTTVTIAHNLGTASVVVQCVDGASPPNVIVPQNIAITSINVVTVTFSSSQTGSCVVNGAAAGTATSVPFSGITAATNTTAGMLVGSGASLAPTGTGTITFNVAVGNILSKSAAYVFLPTDYAVDGDASGGSFSVKLEAAPATGQIHVLSKATAGNTLTLDGNGKTVNGAATQALTVQYSSLTVQYNGTEWRIE